MTGYRVVLTPEARDQIDDLHAFIASAANADIAERFVDGIFDRLDALREFPARATPRDELRPGLRTLAWRRRVTIAFVLEKHEVVVIGVFYGGRDLEALLAQD